MEKKLNRRCPLQSECERNCTFENREQDCDYYFANARPGAEIEELTRAIEEDYMNRRIEAITNNVAPAEMNKLVYIRTSDIYPHPDNPRKDLGDLTELAESIKVNGILQNLTVVKGHFLSIEEYAEMAKAEGVNKADARAMYSDNVAHVAVGYTAIIGHRRLAAAKIAGVDIVPCVISDMDEAQQVRTMLTENMQRSDLTAFEQAQGFQMMLDFGDTVDQISERTGFSSTTVRRRVKLLELDKMKFKKASDNGATLMDFMELEKIEDVKLRNEVLGTIGTQNFRYELNRAISKEKAKKCRALLLEQLNAFAVKIKDAKGLQRIRWYSDGSTDEIEKPEDAGKVKYFYLEESYGVTLYSEAREATPEEIACREKRNREQAEREARQAAFMEIKERAQELRHDFACGLSNAKAKKCIGAIYEYAVYALLDDGYRRVDYPGIAEALNVKLDENDEWEPSDIGDQLSKEPERCLMLAVYFCLEDAQGGYYTTWNFEHMENEELDRVYDFLEKLGYKISDEELAMKTGTHELFVRKEAATDVED